MPDFLTDFADLSAIGATPGGGVDRQAGTEEDRRTRAWLENWLQTHGFAVRYDAVGNQFGLMEVVKGAPYVLAGSHLDSQPLAGRYDGAYGVLAAAHAAVRLVDGWREADITPRYNVGVVNWFNEEGSRFQPSMMGSSVFTGKLPLEQALATSDATGITVGEELRQSGATATDIPDLAHYAEIHIEQGRILSEGEITIGLVDSTWAASKYRLVVYGEQSHTGSTVMADRKDALLGAALVVVAAREIADELNDAPLHSSVSQLEVLPNSPVVVAREVRMHLDLRSPDEEALTRANTMLLERISEIEKRARVHIESVLAHSWGVLSYGAAGVDIARAAANELGLSHQTMMTIAGHDSTNMKDVVPTVMLFVPSVDGISHNEREFTEDADALAGLDLLTGVLRRLCLGESV